MAGLTDDEIWTCRAAIKRIAWLPSRDERQVELSKYPPHLRGVIERGVVQVYPVVQKKRAEAKRRAARTRPK